MMTSAGVEDHRGQLSYTTNTSYYALYIAFPFLYDCKMRKFTSPVVQESLRSFTPVDQLELLMFLSQENKVLFYRDLEKIIW